MNCLGIPLGVLFWIIFSAQLIFIVVLYILRGGNLGEYFKFKRIRVNRITPQSANPGEDDLELHKTIRRNKFKQFFFQYGGTVMLDVAFIPTMR